MPAKPARRQAESAESQNRTGDTAIFSRVLYQLSYLGLNVLKSFLRREVFYPLVGCLSSAIQILVPPERDASSLLAVGLDGCLHGCQVRPEGANLGGVGSDGVLPSR